MTKVECPLYSARPVHGEQHVVNDVRDAVRSLVVSADDLSVVIAVIASKEDLALVEVSRHVQTLNRGVASVVDDLVCGKRDGKDMVR